jgi:hypothetical protein
MEQIDRILNATEHVRQKPWLIKTGVFVFVPHYVHEPEQITFDVGFVSLLLGCKFSCTYPAMPKFINTDKISDILET